MPGRLSPIEQVNLVAKVADLKLELQRQIRTLDALIALLEDKGLIHVEQLQEKSWQLSKKSPALRQTTKARAPVPPPGQSVPEFLRGRSASVRRLGTPPGIGGAGFPGTPGSNGTSGKTDKTGGFFIPGNCGKH